MSVRRRAVVVAATLALVATTGQPAGWAAPAGKPPAGGQQVTLVTGDRVVVTKAGNRIEPAAGRGRMVFHQSQEGNHRFVIPGDAAPLVAAGRLDRRLFDITGLLSLRYDDRTRPDVPLLVMGDSGARAAAQAGPAAKVTRQLPSIRGAAVRLTKRDAARNWPTLKSGTARVRLDGRYQPSLDQSLPQIGAPAAHQAGFTGKGVKIAVLDTGIDSTHPDVAGRIVANQNFTDDPDTTDVVGHGTHVASIAAGSGAASDGRYRGVAPDAQLMIGKVCQQDGCPESAIVAGAEWAAAAGASVVNLSLGGMDFPGAEEPAEAAINRLTAQYGTLFAVAAGNDGPGESTLTSPGSADAALTVGAVDRQDHRASFSGEGPRRGDGGLKPDVTAPGVRIVAASSKDALPADPINSRYERNSGTSMATPHAAGAAALLVQQHPDWRAPELKSALMASSDPQPDTGVFGQGAGRIDVGRAVRQPVTADASSIHFGEQEWPHEDDKPQVRTVTYRNWGSAPVTLSLSMPTSTPAPAGMFTVSPAALTIPAGGQGQVTVTADTRPAAANGLYAGRLTATAGDLRTVTPFVIDRKPPTHNLTLVHLDQGGQPDSRYGTMVSPLSRNAPEYPYDPSGTVTVQLPEGRYAVRSIGIESSLSTLLVYPVVNLTQDTTLVLDKRAAKPVDITVPEPTAAQAAVVAGYRMDPPGDAFIADELTGTDGARVATARLGPVPADIPIASSVGAVFAKPAGDGTYAGTPYLYNALFDLPGDIPTGFRRAVTERDLATVTTSYHSVLPGSVGFSRAEGAGQGANISGPYVRTALPSVRTEFYTPGPSWRRSLGIQDESGLELASLDARRTSFTAGQRIRAPWSAAVLGPDVAADPADTYDVLTRYGNVIAASPSLFTDSAGNFGIGPADTYRTALYRNGELFSDQPAAGGFRVPPQAATYRLQIDAAQAWLPLSTRTSAAWTFRSQFQPGTTSVPLGAMAVRFAPKVDLHNLAAAGVPYAIPVTLQRQAGAPVTKLAGLTVDVSYDDGKNWQPVRLVGAGDNWTALLVHPAQPGFVSLRAKVSDKAGNVVEQTVIHAYQTARR